MDVNRLNFSPTVTVHSLEIKISVWSELNLLKKKKSVFYWFWKKKGTQNRKF
jgi:hypothetical protein